MRLCLLVTIALCPTAAVATDDVRPRISVTGGGSVETPPTLATIGYRVVGEGETSDAAVSALVAKRQRIAAGLAALDRRLDLRASEIAVAEVRGPACRPEYNRPQLSVGPCAITGYVATLQGTIRTAAVKQAGTIVGLIGRLEGSDPRLTGFGLADPGEAQRRAIAAALLDARAKAQAIAAGTGATLGRLISASNASYGDAHLRVQTQDSAPPPPPPPPPPPMAPPITVDIAPRPIETQAQVSVTYEIAP